MPLLLIIGSMRMSELLILCYAHTYMHACRVHTLAGTVDTSHPNAGTMAEETYISNLKYAADQCAEVRITLLMSTVYMAPSQCIQYNSL